MIGDRSTAFKDLRGRPAVLIGQFNNLWTMGLTGSLRYYIDRSTESFSYDVLVGEVSEQLYVSVNTVKSHVRTIYRKLGVSRRHDAVTRGRELGLIPQIW